MQTELLRVQSDVPRSLSGSQRANSLRMSWKTYSVLITFFALNWCAFAADELVEQKRVQELVGRLDSPSRKDRTAARESLLKLGPAALPWLPPIDTLKTASPREAVRQIRTVLEREAARESLAPSIVQLPGPMPLREAVRMIEQQTRNAIDVRDVPTKTLAKMVDLGTDELSFWHAMDELISQTGLRYTEPKAAATLRLEAAPEGMKLQHNVAYSGAWRILASEIELRPIFGSQDSQIARITFDVMAEPRLRPLFLTIASKEFAASDGGDRLLPSFTPDASRELPFGDRRDRLVFSEDFRIPLTAKIQSLDLRGKIASLVAASEEPFEFPISAGQRPIAKRNGGVNVTLQKVQFSAQQDGLQQAHAEIVVAYDSGGPAFESHRTWMFHNRAFVVAEDGRHFPFTAPLSTLRQTDGAVSVGYNFDGLPAKSGQLHFVYFAPTLIVDASIEFAFSGIRVTGN